MAFEKLLNRFSRETSTGRFIPQLDGMRFVAISMVVLFHLNGYVASHSPAVFSAPPEQDGFSRLLVHGHYGVQFFFIISGFILALPFASHYLLDTQRIDLSRYYLRRLTRLEPPYLLSLALICVLIVLLKGEEFGTLFPHLAAGFGYVHNIAYGSGNRLNGVAWSLEIEVQFYLLVPLLTKLFAIPKRLRRRLAIIALGLIALIFQRLFIHGPGGALGLSILNFLQFFLVGFLLADFYLCEWRDNPNRHWAWDVLAVIGCFTLPFVWSNGILISFAFPVLAFLLYYAVFRGVIAYKILGNRWLVTIGGMCYSIYLLHYPIINFIFGGSRSLRLTDNFEINLLAQFLIIVPVVLAISAIFFLLIEKPCMRRDWPSRLWGKVHAMLRPQTPAQPVKLASES
jgi:peptidoglycan/LPS O-acetylase OafA/YrhL